MGGALTDAVWIFAAVLVLVFLAAAVLASRRYLLERSGGTVECALRSPAGSGSWRLGVLSYQHDSLRWYGALGVLLRPEHEFHRRSLSVVSRRPAEPVGGGHPRDGAHRRRGRRQALARRSLASRAARTSTSTWP